MDSPNLPQIVVLGSLDTKGQETEYMALRVKQHGGNPIVIDTSAGGDGSKSISEELDVIRLPVDSARLRSLDRAEAMRVVAEASATAVSRLQAAGRVAGVLAAGGSNAAMVFAAAISAVPFGVPKVVATTMAVVDAKVVIGDRDVTVIYPVADIDGLNSLTATILDQSAAAVVAMAATGSTIINADKHQMVAASMFGVTTPCVQALRTELERGGAEVVVFHMTGIGGRSMESLIADHRFDVVYDVTTTELADLVAGGELSAGEGRLDPLSGPGVPRVVVPGAVDMANFGRRDSVPERFGDRLFYAHNDNVTLMRTNVEENRQIGERIGRFIDQRENSMVVLPLQGVSALDCRGGPFWSPEVTAALFEAIRRTAPLDRLVEVDAHINAPEFAAALLVCGKRLSGLAAG